MPEPKQYYSRLRGKTAIITGGGSLQDGDHIGTGAAMSVWFAREGANICIVDLNLERGQRTERRISAAGGRAIVVAADITSADGCRKAVDATIKAFGGVNILVNNVGANSPNAGWVGGGKIDTHPEDVWRSLLDLNLTSAFLMSKAAITELVKGETSAIVNIASIAGMQATGATAYGCAKAALIAFTHDLALAYGKQGLRANVISPGHLFSPQVSEILDDAGRARRRNITPLGIEGDAWDVAATALFLASDEARYLTSLSIPVDGGVTQMAPLAALQEFLKHESAGG
jgi:NAD(P)-dependent dehydrogenase (short-subunit alcohol dehydrogenase family)